MDDRGLLSLVSFLPYSQCHDRPLRPRETAYPILELEHDQKRVKIDLTDTLRTDKMLMADYSDIYTCIGVERDWWSRLA